MGFPIDFTHRIEARGALSAPGAQDRFLRSLGSQLERRKARAVRIEGSRLEFKGPYFFLASNWNMLAGVSNGQVIVEDGEAGATITYRLSFKWMFWIAIVLFCVLETVLVINSAATGGMGAFFAVGFPLLVGVNIATTLLRFNDLVQSQVRAPQF